MWDYSFAIPSMLILFILLLNYFSFRRLPVRVNIIFVMLLVLEACVISLDILGSIACEEYDTLPRFLVVGVNMLFFVLFLVRPYALLLFTTCIFSLNPSDYPTKSFIARVPLIIGELITLSSVFTGAVFYIGENGYVRGPYYHIINYIFILYLLLDLIVIIQFQSILTFRREKIGLLTTVALLGIGIFFRMYLPRFLILDTFCVMGLLTLHLSFMNPDYYVDRRSGLFNGIAIKTILDEIKDSKSYKIIGFNINNYQEIREIYSNVQMDNGISLIGEYLNRNFYKALKFYNRKGRFIILVKSDYEADLLIDSISKRFNEPWIANNTELYLDIGFIKMDVDYAKYSSDSILHTLSSAFKEAENSIDKEIIIVDSNKFLENLKNDEVMRALDKSILNNKVEIFLQPIMNAETFQVIGAEALCRIRDEAGKIIPPNLFIPLAERSGRINNIGEQVFEKACRFVSENDIDALGIEWINVNISPLQFLKTDLAEIFSAIANKYKVDPKLIHLEITELAIVDENIMQMQINRLKNKGFLFVLDDYGTGYSNIGRIKTFAFINIKLDMTLVWAYQKTPDALLPMVINGFKMTNYSITAEGIETKELAEVMADLGCNYLQGMYFSPPVPEEEFLEYCNSLKN